MKRVIQQANGVIEVRLDGSPYAFETIDARIQRFVVDVPEWARPETVEALERLRQDATVTECDKAITRALRLVLQRRIEDDERRLQQSRA